MEIIMPVLAALLGAAVSTIISHFLTKRRDAAAAERQEARDVRTAERHARELADQRQEAADEQDKRDRIAAVKSFYVEYDAAIGTKYSFESDLVIRIDLALQTFIMEISPLSTSAPALAGDLLKPVDQLAGGITDPEASSKVAARLIRGGKFTIFKPLMEWAVHGTDDKIQHAIDDFYGAAEVMREKYW